MDYRKILEKGFENKIVSLDEARSIGMQKWGNKFIEAGNHGEVFDLMRKLGGRKKYIIIKLGYIGSVFYEELFEDILDFDYKISSEEGIEYTAYALLHKDDTIFIDLGDI